LILLVAVAGVLSTAASAATAEPWPDSATPIIDGEGRRVVLQAAADIETLKVNGSGHRIVLGEHLLSISEALQGSGYTLQMDGRDGGLRCTGPLAIAGTLRGQHRVRLLVDGSEVLFNGYWEGADSGRSRNQIELSNGGRLRLGPEARLNQRLGPFINARVFYAIGDGSDTALELDPEFTADHMGFPQVDTWRSLGFSVLYCRSTTLISHATPSLPSVHKRSGNGNHTHHGVIVLENGTWLVRSERQVYNGQVRWSGRSRIHTDEDLVFIGHYFDDSRCYFGNYTRNESDRLTKTGAGTLYLLGTQIYGPAAELVVAEGRMSVRTDPADPGYRFAEGQDVHRRHLAIDVASGAAIEFRGLPRYGLRSLNCAGALQLHGRLESSGDMRFGSDAALSLSLRERAHGDAHPQMAKPSALVSDGTIHLGGTLTITDTRPKPGSYTIVQADRITGSVTVQAPAGFSASFDAGVVTLTKTP
jgi:opacity protein-like surface antigen